MVSKKTTRLLPGEYCFCGCGEQAAVGRYFNRGHDKKAESLAIWLLYKDGGIPAFLEHHDFAPGGERRAEFERDQRARIKAEELKKEKKQKRSKQ